MTINSISSHMYSQALYSAQHAAANSTSAASGSASEEASETPAQKQSELAAKTTSFEPGKLDVYA